MVDCDWSFVTSLKWNRVKFVCVCGYWPFFSIFFIVAIAFMVLLANMLFLPGE